MPRYIDADKAKELWSGEHPTQIAMRKIFEELPTADVAPRAEVAREIFEEIKKYNRPPLRECGPVYIIKEREFAELEKKYTEEGK